MAGESLNCPACQKMITIPQQPRQHAPGRRLSPPLPSQQQPVPKRATQAHLPYKRKSIRWVVAAIVLFIIAYMAWPYITIWRLYAALRAEDTDAISEHIDFPCLRSSLKEQLNASLLREMANDKEMAENPFSGLAAAFLPKMVESMMDAYVTPAGIAQMFEAGAFKSGKSTAGQESPVPAKERLKAIKYAFFSNPTKFLLKTDDVDFVFKLREWTWKLSEVKLPQSALHGIETEGSQSEDRHIALKENEWYLRTEVSPIDDSKSFFLSRDATERVGSGFMSYTPSLMIRYKEGQLEVFVSLDDYLGSDSIPVTVRIGTSPAKQEEWGISTDGKAIFCPSDNKAFLEKLLRSDRLVIRLTPYGESPVTATFDLVGLSEAIQPIMNELNR